MAKVHIRTARIADCRDIAGLIEPVFETFIAPDYSKEGRRTFRQFVDAKAICERLSGKSEGWVTIEDDEIIGYIEMKANHVVLLFVRQDRHGKGTARGLLRTAVAQRDRTTITLHSSPFAVPVYQRLGFRATGPAETRDGVLFIPMSMAP